MRPYKEKGKAPTTEALLCASPNALEKAWAAVTLPTWTPKYFIESLSAIPRSSKRLYALSEKCPFRTKPHFPIFSVSPDTTLNSSIARISSLAVVCEISYQ